MLSELELELREVHRGRNSPTLPHNRKLSHQARHYQIQFLHELILSRHVREPRVYHVHEYEKR